MTFRFADYFSKDGPTKDVEAASSRMRAMIMNSAADRHAWRTSAEVRRFNLVRLIVIVIAFCIWIAILLLSTVAISLSAQIAVGTALFLWPFVIVLALSLYRSRLIEAVDDRRRLSLAQAIEHDDDQIAAEHGTDFHSIWAVTQKRITFYHETAISQSRRSFMNAQIAAYAGLLVIAGVAAIAAFAPTSTGAVAASVIGVAGAGLSAYIGKTFMKSQASATEQLREYFLQPVEFARVLAAERLLDKLEVNDRGPVVADIIKSMTSSRQAEVPAKAAK